MADILSSNDQHLTTIKDLHNLPFVDVTLRLYDIACPIRENGNGGASFYMQFHYGGCSVSWGDKPEEREVATITSPFSGGSFIAFHGIDDPNSPGHRPFYFLPPDELFYKLAKAIGFDTDAAYAALLADPSTRIITVEERKEADLRNRPWMKPVEETDEEEDARYEQQEKDRIERMRQAQIARAQPDPAPKKYVPPDPTRSVLFPPDYGNNYYVLGYTHAEELPLPRIYYWNSDPPSGSLNVRKRRKKRVVKAHINRYYGQGPHYHVWLQEEEDMVWDGRIRDENNKVPVGWLQCSNSDKGNLHPSLSDSTILGFINTFRSYIEARIYLERIIKERFPRHKIEWEDYCNSNEGIEIRNRLKQARDGSE